MRLLGIVEKKGLYAKWNEKHTQIRYNLDGREVAVYDLDTNTLYYFEFDT